MWTEHVIRSVTVQNRHVHTQTQVGCLVKQLKLSATNKIKVAQQVFIKFCNIKFQ